MGLGCLRGSEMVVPTRRNFNLIYSGTLGTIGTLRFKRSHEGKKAKSAKKAKGAKRGPTRAHMREAAV